MNSGIRTAHKLVLLASHHPFQSYGIRDGRLTLKDHLFPLTSYQQESLRSPARVGSVYSFFRSAFSSPNDTKHPLHKDMVKKVDDMFDGFPNLVHIAGHEQGLQLIRDRQIQVVSGDGAKHLRRKKQSILFSPITSPGFA